MTELICKNCSAPMNVSEDSVNLYHTIYVVRQNKVVTCPYCNTSYDYGETFVPENINHSGDGGLAVGIGSVAAGKGGIAIGGDFNGDISL